MRQLNLSILPSNSIWISTQVIVWTVGWLLLFEIIIAQLPNAPAPKELSKLQNYLLEYGRSVEGKLYRMIVPTDEDTAPIALAGWLLPEKWKNLPDITEKADELSITIYGSSFSNHVGNALTKLDNHIITRLIAGPFAPPSHSYAAFLLDKQQYQSQVVAMGILASAVVGMTTITGTNRAFEHPAPYTYPKYHLINNQLQTIEPKIHNLTELRNAMNNPQLWQEYVAQLRTEDGFYEPFLFQKNFLDNSVLVRFLRRAWAARHTRLLTEKIHTSQGFTDSPEMQTLRVIVQQFAAQVRQDGRLPLLLLFNNQGYSDHLYQALAPTIQAADIPTMSTHTLASANDPRNFISDGHFTPKANKLFATEVLKIVRERLKK